MEEDNGSHEKKRNKELIDVQRTILYWHEIKKTNQNATVNQCIFYKTMHKTKEIAGDIWIISISGTDKRTSLEPWQLIRTFIVKRILPHSQVFGFK